MIWDNGGENMNLGQSEFIDLSPLWGDYRLIMEAYTFLKQMPRVYFNGLLEKFVKKIPYWKGIKDAPYLLS